MADQEMIERVALAICGDDNPANILAIHRTRAVEAIKAMREPTQQMIDAGWNAKGDQPQTHWQAMIDSILDG